MNAKLTVSHTDSIFKASTTAEPLDRTHRVTPGEIPYPSTEKESRARCHQVLHKLRFVFSSFKVLFKY